MPRGEKEEQKQEGHSNKGGIDVKEEKLNGEREEQGNVEVFDLLPYRIDQ